MNITPPAARAYKSLPECRSKAARCLVEHREPRRGPTRMGDGHLALGFVCVALAAAANLLGGAVVTFRRWDDRLLRYAVALGAGFMLAARGTRRQAILAAGAVGLATLVGGLAIFGERTLVGPALAVSAGVTLYVAASDLVPEVNREQGTAVALTVFAGVVLYYVTERL